MCCSLNSFYFFIHRKSHFVVDCVLCKGEMTTCCFKGLVKSGFDAYVWFSFFLRSQQWRVFSWLCWSERGLQPWRSYRAGDRISELQLNGKLRWGNINHFFQLSSWRTWGVWTKRTARLQWNVAEPALPGIWPYLVLGLLSKQTLIWAVRWNVEGMYRLWRRAVEFWSGYLERLIVWPEYWTRSCLNESIWVAGGIFLLHWCLISVWINTLFRFSWHRAHPNDCAYPQITNDLKRPLHHSQAFLIYLIRGRFCLLCCPLYMNYNI